MNATAQRQLKKFAREAFAREKGERLPAHLEQVREAALERGWTFRPGELNPAVHVAEKRSRPTVRRQGPGIHLVYGSSAKALLERLALRLETGLARQL